MKEGTAELGYNLRNTTEHGSKVLGCRNAQGVGRAKEDRRDLLCVHCVILDRSTAHRIPKVLKYIQPFG